MIGKIRVVPQGYTAKMLYRHGDRIYVEIGGERVGWPVENIREGIESGLLEKVDT